MMSELEKELLDKSLHGIYDNDEFEDFGKIEIKSVLLSDGNKNLKLITKFTLDSTGLVKNYLINLSDLQNYSVKPSTTSYIEILAEDPKLLFYNSNFESLYFTNPPKDSNLLINEIFSVLNNKYEMKITLENIFTSYNQFIYRNNIDYGLYVTTPKEIVKLLFPLLDKQEMNPKIYSVATQMDKRSYKIIYIGESWFIFNKIYMEVVNS